LKQAKRLLDAGQAEEATTTLRRFLATSPKPDLLDDTSDAGLVDRVRLGFILSAPLSMMGFCSLLGLIKRGKTGADGSVGLPVRKKQGEATHDAPPLRAGESAL
jgi:hypothetical protein